MLTNKLSFKIGGEISSASDPRIAIHEQTQVQKSQVKVMFKVTHLLSSKYVIAQLAI